MKLNTSLHAFAILLIAGAVNAVPLKPVVLATKGEAALKEGAAVAPRQMVNTGSVLTTGKDSRLAIALAPGQMVVLKKNTQLEVVSAHDAAAGKGAVIRLIVGSVSCDIDPTHGHKEPVFKLLAGDQTIQAKGTKWESSVAADGSVTTVVVSSTVSVSVPGSSAPVPVTAGSVMVVSATGGATMVNLVTGQVTSFSADGSSESGPATAAQLGAAQAVFQTALADTGTTGAATTALVAQINTTLASAGVPTVVTVTTGAENVGRDVTVSSEQP